MSKPIIPRFATSNVRRALSTHNGSLSRAVEFPNAARRQPPILRRMTRPRQACIHRPRHAHFGFKRWRSQHSFSNASTLQTLSDPRCSRTRKYAGIPPILEGFATSLSDFCRKSPVGISISYRTVTKNRAGCVSSTIELMQNSSATDQSRRWYQEEFRLTHQ